MAVDPKVAAELLARKSDIRMPSAEGEARYPRDLLELSKDELRSLLGSGNGNGRRARARETATADESADEA